MLVRELIERLQSMPQDVSVQYTGAMSCYEEIEGVYAPGELNKGDFVVLW